MTTAAPTISVTRQQSKSPNGVLILRPPERRHGSVASPSGGRRFQAGPSPAQHGDCRPVGLRTWCEFVHVPHGPPAHRPPNGCKQAPGAFRIACQIGRRPARLRLIIGSLGAAIEIQAQPRTARLRWPARHGQTWASKAETPDIGYRHARGADAPDIPKRHRGPIGRRPEWPHILCGEQSVHIRPADNPPRSSAARTARLHLQRRSRGAPTFPFLINASSATADDFTRFMSCHELLPLFLQRPHLASPAIKPSRSPTLPVPAAPPAAPTPPL